MKINVSKVDQKFFRIGVFVGIVSFWPILILSAWFGGYLGESVGLLAKHLFPWL